MQCQDMLSIYNARESATITLRLPNFGFCEAVDLSMVRGWLVITSQKAYGVVSSIIVFFS